MTPIKLEGDDDDDDGDGDDGDDDEDDDDEDEDEDEESTPVPRFKRHHVGRWVSLLPYVGKLSRILTRMNVRALSEKLLPQSLVP